MFSWQLSIQKQSPHPSVQFWNNRYIHRTVPKWKVSATSDRTIWYTACKKTLLIISITYINRLRPNRPDSQPLAQLTQQHTNSIWFSKSYADKLFHLYLCPSRLKSHQTNNSNRLQCTQQNSISYSYAKMILAILLTNYQFNISMQLKRPSTHWQYYWLRYGNSCAPIIIIIKIIHNCHSWWHILRNKYCHRNTGNKLQYTKQK